MVTEDVTVPARAVFLAALAECGNVTKACAKAEITRMMAYRWRARDEEFAAEWDEAAKVGLEGLEDEARRRAYEGYERPVYQGGSMVGTVKEYSDTLMTLLLKGGMPDKYRERVSTEITGKGGGPIEHAYNRFTAVPTEALEEVERFLAEQTDDDAAE
jgi:hypothetical protein